MSSAPARARRQVVLDAEVDLDLANYTTTPYSLDLNANASVPPRRLCAAACAGHSPVPGREGTLSGDA
jgi:hypothetical protein